MSKARTRAIESGVERAYRGKGRSAADARYIAGAVMGDIKRERTSKRAHDLTQCLASAQKRRSRMSESSFRKELEKCINKGVKKK